MMSFSPLAYEIYLRTEDDAVCWEADMLDHQRRIATSEAAIKRVDELLRELLERLPR